MNPNKHSEGDKRFQPLNLNVFDSVLKDREFEAKAGRERCDKLIKENAELKAEVAGWQRGEAKVKEAMDKVYDERDNWKRNYEALKARAELLASTNTELGMQVKKAEAERDKAAEERGVWESEAHRLAGIVSEQTGQIENLETGARECRVTLGAERKDYHRLLAKSR